MLLAESYHEAASGSNPSLALLARCLVLPWSGGLTTWRKAATLAELYQIPIAAHHDPQIHVHALASSPTGFILESFADPKRDPLWFELFSQRPEIVDGFMTLPDTPGLGLELREATLETYGVKLT